MGFLSENCVVFLIRKQLYFLSSSYIQKFYPIHQLQMITCNCCAHCWTQSTKCINLPQAHNCEKKEIKNRAASNDGINGKALKRGWWECCCIPWEGGLEQMAMADMGWEVFLRLTQVSGAARAGVPCQLRCIEGRCLSVRSSLTPRSVSSGPQAVVILILPAGPEIKRHIGRAFENFRIACRFRVTHANAGSAYRNTKYIVIQPPPPPPLLP